MNTALFTVIDGTEKYKVVDLETGGVSYFTDKIEAYKMAWILLSMLGHNYRMEIREGVQS